MWFSAVKAEDERDFVTAASNYVEDATHCLGQNLVRSALSCTCAAGCLGQLGAHANARTLYAMAATIYLDNSKIAMAESIREALWSLQEAAEGFAFAGEYEEAEACQRRHAELAARTSPFSRAAALSSSSSSPPTSSAAAPAIEALKSPTFPRPREGTEAELPQALAEKIDRLIESHRKISVAKADKGFDASYVMRSIDSAGGSRLSEKSIAS
ncbi:MAG TPA: hypothetical protein VJP79_10410 [Nitrososphaera sp.]|nr:hypothetical protein [Nitrososphaera sp.]